MPTTAAALTLLDLIQSQRITAVIYAAAKLDIAALLRDGTRSLDELAAATRAHHASLKRLLTALSTIGLCTESDGRYALTEVGAALDDASETSFKAWAIFEGEMLTKSWWTARNRDIREHSCRACWCRQQLRADGPHA